MNQDIQKKPKKTQKDLAIYLEINEDTLTNWKKNKPKLFDFVWNGWLDYIESFDSK